MDFDFGNLIYIIATLVAIMVGVLGKKKKPARGSAPGNVAPKRKPSIFETLGKEIEEFVEQSQVKGSAVPKDELYDDTVYDPVQSDYEEEQAESESEPVFESLLANYDGILSQNNMKNFDLISSEGDSSSGEMQVLDLDEDQGQNYFDVVKEFDLESAVIYSAVINRIDY